MSLKSIGDRNNLVVPVSVVVYETRGNGDRAKASIAPIDHDASATNTRNEIFSMCFATQYLTTSHIIPATRGYPIRAVRATEPNFNDTSTIMIVEKNPHIINIIVARNV
jgi:hypothetical protein